MFKKVISILLATVLVVSMTGCSELTSVVTSTSEPTVNTSVDKSADNTQTSTTTSVSTSAKETQTSASVSEPEPTPEPEPQPEPEPEGYAKYISSPEAWEEMPKEEYDAIPNIAGLTGDQLKSWVAETPVETRVASYIKRNIIENADAYSSFKTTFDMAKNLPLDEVQLPTTIAGAVDSPEVMHQVNLFAVTGEDVIIYLKYRLLKMANRWPEDLPEPHEGITLDDLTAYATNYPDLFGGDNILFWM